MKTLIKNPRTRRSVSFSLVGLGGVLLFLAPEGVLFGWILLLLGLSLEFIGIALGHHEQS